VLDSVMSSKTAFTTLGFQQCPRHTASGNI
jgi:hypothetical protein